MIHPRKEQEDSDLSITSVFGSAKATQEADNVLIIQRDAKHHVKLDIRKNRFDGGLGSIPLVFDPKACRLHERNGSSRPMSDELAVIDAEAMHSTSTSPLPFLFDDPDDTAAEDRVPEPIRRDTVPPSPQVTLELEPLEPTIQKQLQEAAKEPFSQFTQIIHR